MPPPPPSSSPFWRVFAFVTRLDTLLFRVSGGRRSLIARVPTLVLQHIGRKSGQARTSPLICLDHSPRLVVVASKGGADRHPDWFHNLVAMPGTEVELAGGEKRWVRPRVASTEEKAELWPDLVAAHPDYATYATYTERDIPVVVLEPADG